MLKLISLDYDARLRAYCAMVTSNYKWFIGISAGAEENLRIQRKIISGSKPYATLRADLRRGCLLPPLVVAAKNIAVPLDEAGGSLAAATEIWPVLTDAIEKLTPENTYIIDGLQRTNAIRQTNEELEGSAQTAFLERIIRVEVWINISFGALAYRMLLLNAGQRPMSIKHQVEILSMKLSEELASIPGIDIFTSIEGRRRRQAGQFQLAKLSQAFQAWLQGQPNIDLKNTVMEQLLAENAIDVLGAEVRESIDGPREAREGFKGLVAWIVAVDRNITEANLEFFSNDTVLLGIAAAVGAAERNESVRPRMVMCLAKLAEAAKVAPSDEALAVNEFNTLRAGIDAAKRNVGEATRDLVFYAFQEHFYSSGEKSMSECWRFAAGRS